MSDKSLILVVEDDKMMNAGICFHLGTANYEALPVYTCRDARQQAAKGVWSLFLLDVNLPDGDGMELCRELRQQYAVPVILLTAKDMEEDMLAGFDSGADDYITKPFSIPILLKRVGVALGRNAPDTTSIHRCGNLVVDTKRGTVMKSGEPVRLTMAEWKLLQFFIGHREQLLSREQILEVLWDSEANFVSEHTLTALISRLRGKIADERYGYIKTLYGLGYKWMGERDA